MTVRRGVGDITLNPADANFFTQPVPLPMWAVLLMVVTIAHATLRMGK